MIYKRKNDSGYKTLLANLEHLHGVELQVGIFGARARQSANGSKADDLAYRFKIHNEGIGNPKRETLAPSMEAVIKDDKIVTKIIFSKLSVGNSSRAINRAKIRLIANLKEFVTRLKSPPKTKRTIRAAMIRYKTKKKMQNPLIQTGEMRASITSRFK